VAAVRARRTLTDIEGWLPAWAGQHLRGGAEMAQRFARYPQAVATAAALGRELAFPLRLIAPELPPFPVPAGHTEMSYLRELAFAGARDRYGPPEVAAAWAKEHGYVHPYEQIEHELKIIEELDFPGYFLVVWDIVEFCRTRGILCQGRGSAANSAVCYAIGLTAVDSVRYGLLFERFLSPQREGAPDIDLDIESDRREEAIQHVYSRYGRHYTAQVANVISYRPKSAIRDVAKALGYSTGQQDAWSKSIEQGYYWAPAMKIRQDDRSVAKAAQIAQVDAGDVEIPNEVLVLAEQLQKAPRHLGIHSGGMVICDRPIIEVCPVEWGRMPNRSVLQWDKDDCAGAGLVKFDLLGLGMLSALTYCFELIAQWHGVRYGLHQIPTEDPLVYGMLCKADTVGVFQVESRAQMATLPRLEPREFYDLVIEIALIRPGPIQGESVHPYIWRRNGTEQVTYPHPMLEKALEKTKGVPLFQEQLMQLAIDAAGCTRPRPTSCARRWAPSAATSAWRPCANASMPAWRRTASPARWPTTSTSRSAPSPPSASPSHAISFAFLVYASSWLKLYYPAAFTAALLNAQPMGFYYHSRWSRMCGGTASSCAARRERLGRRRFAGDAADASTYTGPGPAQPSIRLGLSSVRTISVDTAAAVITARDSGGLFTSMTDLVQRAALAPSRSKRWPPRARSTLGRTRRGALWSAAPVSPSAPSTCRCPPWTRLRLPAARDDGPRAAHRRLLGDVDHQGHLPHGADPRPPRRTRRHLRDRPASCPGPDPGPRGGVVTHRQRPNTAQGIIFPEPRGRDRHGQSPFAIRRCGTATAGSPGSPVACSSAACLNASRA
jgi:error-prone DNA polymerase